ncbi:MAG: uracil-DNA glycosylase family protein [Acidimicrobiales bacterium]
MDRATIDVYEQESARYEARRRPRFLPQAEALGRRRPSGVAVDLGCGPGWYTAALGAPVVALDGAMAMVRRTREVATGCLPVQADLAALPFRRGALAAGWARNTYLHLRQDEVPMACNDLHHALVPDAPIEVTLLAGDDDEGYQLFPDEDLPGRWFSMWADERIRDVLHGAGFVVDELCRDGRGDDDPAFTVRARRAPTLPDFVASGMRLLVCGLNPSVHAATAGVGYVTPGNRFWPAALTAGLVTRDRDGRHALREHGVGMTDLVKRATPRAAELTGEEYRSGLERLHRLCAWLRPAAVCFVGLAGWRAAVDRRAGPGWQPQDVGGRPAYVMPSTSGLNAATPLPVLVDHLRAAALGP